MAIFMASLIALFFNSADSSHNSAQQHAPVQIKKIERGGPGMRKSILGDLVSVPELAALFSDQDGTIVVDHILESEMRAKGYEKTDLEEGDVVLMANGHTLGSVAALKTLYDSAAIGTTVKLGVKRKDEMLIASFVKADPEKLPKVRMIVSHGDDENMFGIPQAGLILSEKGKTVIVKEVLPDPEIEVSGEAKRGDLVLKINGSSVSSLKEFRTAYEKLPIGSKIQLVTSRSGKDLKLEFAKPKDDGKMIIRRQVNQ